RTAGPGWLRLLGRSGIEPVITLLFGASRLAQAGAVARHLAPVVGLAVPNEETNAAEHENDHDEQAKDRPAEEPAGHEPSSPRSRPSTGPKALRARPLLPIPPCQMCSRQSSRAT